MSNIAARLAGVGNNTVNFGGVPALPLPAPPVVVSNSCTSEATNFNKYLNTSAVRSAKNPMSANPFSSEYA